MIGIFLIYFIGKMYYKLADEYRQNKWLYAVLGVVMYYAGQLFFGLIIGVIMGVFNPQLLEDTSEMALSLICLPFGIAACWGFYKILKTKWEKTATQYVEGIEDIGADTENRN